MSKVQPPLRGDPAQEHPLDPLRFPRLDLPSKVDGSHVFAGDVRLPGMVHTAIRHGPIGDTVLAIYDKAHASGVRQGQGSPASVPGCLPKGMAS